MTKSGTIKTNNRKHQIHYKKILNPQVRVPRHEAFKPIKAKIEEARQKERLRKQRQIQRQNMHIMSRLFSINKQKSKISSTRSLGNFSLPPILLKKKPMKIPQHQHQNNIIAEKLIKSKSSINVKAQLRQYHQKEKIKKNLCRYGGNQLGNDGRRQSIFVKDRKKYIAQLMMMKKLRINDQVQSRIKKIIEQDKEPRLGKGSKQSSGRKYFSNLS